MGPWGPDSFRGIILVCTHPMDSYPSIRNVYHLGEDNETLHLRGGAWNHHSCKLSPILPTITLWLVLNLWPPMYHTAETLTDSSTTRPSATYGADGQPSFNTAIAPHSMRTHCMLSTEKSSRLYPRSSCSITPPLLRIPSISHILNAISLESTASRIFQTV